MLVTPKSTQKHKQKTKNYKFEILGGVYNFLSPSTTKQNKNHPSNDPDFIFQLLTYSLSHTRTSLLSSYLNYPFFFLFFTFHGHRFFGHRSSSTTTTKSSNKKKKKEKIIFFIFTKDSFKNSS